MNPIGSTHKHEGHNKLFKGPVTNFEKAGLTIEDVQDKVNEYFSQATVIPEESQFVYFNQGKAVVDPGTRIFTFPGLCYYLGFDSREGFRKAMKNEKSVYSTVLKKAYIRMQSYFESLAIRNSNPAGPMFILKNMDYSDQQTINQNVTEIKAPEIVTADKETGTELRRLMKKAV